MKKQVQRQTTPVPRPAFAPVRSNLLQRRCACGGTPGFDGECAECRRKRLRGSQRNHLDQTVRSQVPPIVHDVLRTPGQPLDSATRAFMEPRFGHDFSKVQVHADSQAAESARAVNALAFTVGREIVFGAGQYAPRTNEGKVLLAHELTHVVQQGQWQPASYLELSIGRSSDVDEIEGHRASVLSLDSGDVRPLDSNHDATVSRRAIDERNQNASLTVRVGTTDDACEREADLLGEQIARGGRRTEAALTRRPSVQRQPAPAPAPAVPAPETEDCQLWQTTMLSNHLNNARAWVDDAAKKVDDYAYVFASPRHSAAPRSPATAAIVRDALRDNFHTTSPSHVLAINDNFASLRSELNSAFTFECETSGCGATEGAYVRGAFSWFRQKGDVHVCPIWFGCSDYFTRVTMLIHERAHQYPGASGDTYEWQPSYATLSPSDAIDNAESYAVAARQIYHGGAHGPGTGGTC